MTTNAAKAKLGGMLNDKAREERLPRYDIMQSYDSNYVHAPEVPAGIEIPAAPGTWNFCGLPINSPLAIAAGPLLNGRWILYYAALGFDVLTYKTVRSTPRACYPLPNLQPVNASVLRQAGTSVIASGVMQGSWAVSFGMPSQHPDVWRADIEWTKARLPKGKLLSVSVVGTSQPGWSLEELADDFARCARWAAESGTDAVEANFSCPNVATLDGQLFQQPVAAAVVAQRVRAAIGSTPFCLKVGFIPTASLAENVLDAVAPFVDAIAMTNCISASVVDRNKSPLFDGQPRGIGGAAIRAASVRQVAMFHALAKKRGIRLQLVGVGGIATSDHVRDYLAAGASLVQLATAPMLDPLVGIRIRSALAHTESSRLDCARECERQD